jgi:hypothetical protein
VIRKTLFRKCVLLIVTLALSACSSFDPYQRSKLLDVPVEVLAKKAATEKDASGVLTNGGYEPLAGNLHGAVAAIKDQRYEWYESLTTQAKVRAATQLGIIGVSAVAIYNGFRTGASNDDGKKGLVLAGALGGAAYAAGDFYVNTAQEDAYIEGIRGLTCSLLAIEPLRLTVVEFDRMDEQRKTLTRAINAMDQELLNAQATLRYAETDTSPAAKVRQEAQSAFTRARYTLLSSDQLAWELSKSGITLLREGDIVFANLAAKIKASNKATIKPEAFANSLAGILGKFREVKIDVENEKPRTMTAAITPEVKDAPTAPTTTAKAVSSTSAVTVPADDGTTLLSQASLKMLSEQIAKNLKQQTDKKEKAALEKVAKRIEEAEKTAKQAELLASVRTLTAEREQGECRRSGRQDCVMPANLIAEKLATLTADLYAARRPLSHQLLVFNSARAAVTKNRACTGAGSPMTVSPDADANVEPGQVYVITINNVTTPPTVNLKGDAAFKYLVGPSVNQYTYQIEVGKEAKGAIDLSISDRGLATEEIKLTVVQKK